MEIVTESVTKEALREMAAKMDGGLVKAVVDVAKKILVVDADLHADEEHYLLEHGSKQTDLWGINLYPDLDNEDFIEFDSMINVRPSFGNTSRGVDDKTIQHQIREIVGKLVP